MQPKSSSWIANSKSCLVSLKNELSPGTIFIMFIYRWLLLISLYYYNWRQVQNWHKIHKITYKLLIYINRIWFILHKQISVRFSKVWWIQIDTHKSVLRPCFREIPGWPNCTHGSAFSNLPCLVSLDDRHILLVSSLTLPPPLKFSLVYPLVSYHPNHLNLLLLHTSL
jgi:hypothetical protein